MTDDVFVQSANMVDFAILAIVWLYAGPDPQLVIDAAEASLAAFLAKARRLGRDITRSAIIAAIHVAGVQRVDLIEPAVDQVMTMLQAGWCGDITLTYAGVGE